MKRIFLPYETDVESIALQTYAFPLGVIKANIKNYDCWLCHKFVNFTCSPDHVYGLYDEDAWGFKEGIVRKRKPQLTQEWFEDDCARIMEANRSQMDSGSYIFGVYDEYHIPLKKAYGKYPFRHGYILFGYDDEKRIYHSAGYLGDGHYRRFEISYTDYVKSLLALEIRRQYMYYYTPDKDYVPKVNIDHIKSEINNYLQSRTDKQETESERLYGLKALDSFQQYVTNENHLDLRSGRGYMEHKRVMYERLKYLYEHSYLKDEGICREYLEEVYRKARVVFGLFIKYHITGEKDIRRRLSKLVCEVNEKEKYLIEKVLTDVFV